MKTIPIKSEWNYDGVIKLPKHADQELIAEVARVIKEVGDAAYKQGREDAIALLSNMKVGEKDDKKEI